MIALPAPMLLTERMVPSPLGRPGWVFEIKADGWRLVAGVKDGQARLMTRRGVDVTGRFAEVACALVERFGDGVVLDGEVCVLDQLGRADFDALQTRALRRKWRPGLPAVTYCVFDVLAADRVSLLDEPLETRKARLAALLAEPVPSVLLVGDFPAEDAVALHAQATVLKLEGLVAKRLGSPYQPGVRTPDWVKIRIVGVPAERFKRK